MLKVVGAASATLVLAEPAALPLKVLAVLGFPAIAPATPLVIPVWKVSGLTPALSGDVVEPAGCPSRQ
jgi:hypothetical protein